MSIEIVDNPIVTQDEAVAYLSIEKSNWTERHTLLLNGVHVASRQYLQIELYPKPLVRDFDGDGARSFFLSPIPIVSVSSLKWLDTEGTETDIDSGDYWVDLGTGEVTFKRTYVPNRPQVIRASFTTGWAQVPEDVKLAALDWLRIRLRKAEHSGDDVLSMSLNGQSTSYVNEDMPRFVRTVLDFYRTPGGFGAGLWHE